MYSTQTTNIPKKYSSINSRQNDTRCNEIRETRIIRAVNRILELNRNVRELRILIASR